MRHTRDEPPLRGAAYGISVAVLTLVGVLLGIVTAFAVPWGYRVGVTPGPITGDATAPAQALAASATGSYGTLLSVGVVLALVGVFVLGVVTRLATGSRLSPLGPITGWLLVALLALSSGPFGGDLLIPAMVTPGIPYLFAGVIGGAVTLLPTVLLPGRLRPTPA